MNTFFVRAVVDINCAWSGNNPPAYRLYVNNELFTERVYVANQEQFIKLMIQLQAPVGKYELRIEPVDNNFEFRVSNGYIEQGPARFVKNKKITILDQEQFNACQ